MSTLQIRLKNCIQTILEFETELNSGIWRRHFNEEFSILKDYLQRIDLIELVEDDVRRLEAATDSFLSELRPSSHKEGAQQKRLLQ
ncbi:MAG: conserved hypothetical protein [Candidatus Desulfovibrio kirbyi]|uniref:Uncharacterized protein n=1 Tax=Candidatus Desulfovibrio kirbyi TaxID=2696086 RepID=A0A6L2R5P3_9BACT|nr:MAG: conserved hypothetical protein [Candidatus Desulfovibrio kirbyi]